MEELDAARERIRRLDQQLLDLVRERVTAARRAGQAKREKGLGLRDKGLEARVVERFARGFEEEGLNPRSGEDLARLLIGEALREQEEDAPASSSSPRASVLVVGGAGAMGSWMVRFLTGLGYEASVHDPAGPLQGVPYEQELYPAADEADVVLLATPPTAMGSLLRELEGVEALVVDIASLKAPIQDELSTLAQHQPVASVHPLWGPNTRVLSDKNVLVLDCGNPEATRQAREIFEASAANVVQMPLSEHDRLMAFTLGLPHAVNLAYAEVLTREAQDVDGLGQAGGPTFLKQSSVAAEVAREDPQLYREIQALNEATPRVYEALKRAVDTLAERIEDPEAFEEAMKEYRATLDGYEGWVHP